MYWNKQRKAKLQKMLFDYALKGIDPTKALEEEKKIKMKKRQENMRQEKSISQPPIMIKVLKPETIEEKDSAPSTQYRYEIHLLVVEIIFSSWMINKEFSSKTVESMSK